MKTPRLAEAMHYIDDELVAGAITYAGRRRNGWLRWGPLAACLCLAVVGAALWTRSTGLFGSIPEGGGGSDGGVPGGDGMWPEGVDPVAASVAVFPAGEDLRDVADATSVPLSEAAAREIEGLGAYLPETLPAGCRYGKGGYYETVMKDGARYHMLRATYESGQAAQPAPVPEDGESAAELAGSTAFLWMVWGHRPDTARPIYRPAEVSASLLERQDGVFYLDFGGVYVGIERLEIGAEALLAVIASIG